MLKVRILTALVLMIVIFAMMWGLSPLHFALAMMIFFLAGAWEWSRLAGLQGLYRRIGYMLLMLLTMAAALYLPAGWVLACAIPAWIWAVYAVSSYQQQRGTLGSQRVLVKSVCGIVMLVTCWVGMVVLQSAAPHWLLLGLMITWAVDTGAYFTGRRWGRHPLADRISPKKTREGFWGGILLAVIVLVSCSFFLPLSNTQRILFALLVTISALFAVIGDLFVSLLKRQAGVKDTGRMLPGHGGLLDRFDSTLSTIPIFALGFLLLKLV